MNRTVASPSRPASQTLLAFDFGERHIGVAVGDTETGLACTAGHISAQGNAKRMAAIDALIREWSPELLVVGLPLALDGTEQGITARARHFARQLAARFRLPVDFADERLSSVDAEQTLRIAGRGGRKHKHLVHAEAARILLQEYFDEHAAKR